MRAIFVAREVKKEKFMDYFFAPSAGHSTTRLIHYVALKRSLVTFTEDATNAFFHIDDSEEGALATSESIL